MTIEQTLQKVIDGGGPPELLLGFEYLGIRAKEHHMFEAVLHPLFWQSLGKGMGWGKIKHPTKDEEHHGEQVGEIYWQDCDDPYVCCRSGWEQEEWLYHWHRFIDHLAEGKSIEGYFETL